MLEDGLRDVNLTATEQDLKNILSPEQVFKDITTQE